jgi:hypothetical protein
MTEQVNEQATENEENSAAETEAPEELTFDSWLAKQDEGTRGLLNSHTSGLKNALEDERTERKKLQRQIRELSEKAEKGSEMRQQLETLNTSLETNARKADFFEEAHANKVSNLRLAWMAVNEGELMNSRGQVDWDAFRSQYPELIEKPASTPRSNAGTGTGTPPPSRLNMNDMIRQAAGRS